MCHWMFLQQHITAAPRLCVLRDNWLQPLPPLPDAGSLPAAFTRLQRSALQGVTPFLPLDFPTAITSRSGSPSSFKHQYVTEQQKPAALHVQSITSSHACISANISTSLVVCFCAFLLRIALPIVFLLDCTEKHNNKRAQAIVKTQVFFFTLIQ